MIGMRQGNIWSVDQQRRVLINEVTMEMCPTRKTVRVDSRLCEGHALCVELAPEVFDLSDDVATCNQAPSDTDIEDIDAAIAACPRQAINWVEP
jgi:ferredoxin